MHHHLNHPNNQDILPRLFKQVGHIFPPLAGHRLLKLICTAFFDGNMYSEYRKLDVGAYGTVYEATTGLEDPEKVAIKKMAVPVSIEDRCVLHDIFNEISCLEELRLEGSITDLYDYGVDQTDYYIVMKLYPTSVKKWRS
jgi:serine/threonine protein kinase